MTSTMIPMMANTICTTISPMVSPFLVAIPGAGLGYDIVMV